MWELAGSASSVWGLHQLHLDCMHFTYSNLHSALAWCAATSEWEVPRRLEEPEGKKEKKQRWRLEREKEKNRKMCSRSREKCDVIGLHGSSLVDRT
jgi:hypothetical protein